MEFGSRRLYTGASMKKAGKAVIYGLGFVVLTVAAHSAVRSPGAKPLDAKSPDEQPARPDPASELSSDNPYGAIVERNVFDLHDPVVVNKEPDKPKEPPANVKMTGITTIFGHKQ